MSQLNHAYQGRQQPKLLDQVRYAIRAKHYSLRTEEAYVQWIRRFILFHNKRHPRDMGAEEVRQFLSDLAVNHHVAASTQNQALSAILFLYQHVLRQGIGWINDVVRAKKPKKLPVVLTQEEVKIVFNSLSGSAWLMATLLYGSGLRLMECIRLRVKDVDFAYNHIVVRDGKGDKDRVTMLPLNVKAPLEHHLQDVKRLHDQDLAEGFGRVYLPYALERKYPNANQEWAWQYVFPAASRFARPAHRCPKAASCESTGVATRRESGDTESKDRRGCELSYLSALVCHAFARGRLRYSDCPGITRS
jgi:integron integrase